MIAVGADWAALRRAAQLQRGEQRRLAASVVLGFGAVAAATGLLTTSGYLISRAAQRPNILTLTAAIVGVRAFGIARAVLRYAERLVSHDLALRVLARLRSSFYATLAPLVPGAIGGHTRGELLSRFVGDVDSLQDLYLRALAPPAVALLVIAAAGLTAWLMLPAAALIVAGMLALAAVVTPLLAAVLANRAGRRQAAARARLTAELVEAIDGGAELAVAGRGHERLEAIKAANASLVRLARRDAVTGAAATALGSGFNAAAIIGMLLVAIPAVHAGALSGLLLAALVFLVFGAFEGIAPLPIAARRMRSCIEAARRLDHVRHLEPAVVDPSDPRRIAVEPAPSLALDRVSFRYGVEGPRLLDHADLLLFPGCRIALCGPSGAGKTTIAHLLVRFIDPTGGAVTLEGVDVRRLAQDAVRRVALLAAQDAHVFTTTIRENLLLARRTATEAELWSALDSVRLADWVRALPDGLDTLVGEDGELVSGGQRQRITVARALLADTSYLILDEPTAQLDEDTAAAVIAGIEAASGDRGLLLITHRGEGLERFTRYELSDGRLRASAERPHPVGDLEILARVQH